MTVGELKKRLEDFDETDNVMISYDAGYCYGDINSVVKEQIVKDYFAIILEE